MGDGPLIVTLRLLHASPAPMLRARLAGRGPGRHAAAAILAASCPATLVADDAGADLVIMWWDGTEPLATSSVPVVAICANPADRATAFAAGASAALSLPVDDALLLAVAGRAPRASAPAPHAILASGPLLLDLRARTLAVRGRDVPLTLKEFDLAAFLLERPGACCTRDEILDVVWGIDFETGTNTVDVYIYTLRRKLRNAGLAGLIRTVRGVGYRLDLPD